MDDIDRELITELVTEGLYTDGAHHKQWFLEQIYAALWGHDRLEGAWEDDFVQCEGGSWIRGVQPLEIMSYTLINWFRDLNKLGGHNEH